MIWMSAVLPGEVIERPARDRQATDLQRVAERGTDGIFEPVRNCSRETDDDATTASQKVASRVDETSRSGEVPKPH